MRTEICPEADPTCLLTNTYVRIVNETFAKTLTIASHDYKIPSSARSAAVKTWNRNSQRSTQSLQRKAREIVSETEASSEPHIRTKRRSRGMAYQHFFQARWLRAFSCTLSRRSPAVASVSERLAKWKRIRLRTGSWKKLEPGTAATPTSRASHSQNSTSSSHREFERCQPSHSKRPGAGCK